jgi:hypothetical protein
MALISLPIEDAISESIPLDLEPKRASPESFIRIHLHRKSAMF